MFIFKTYKIISCNIQQRNLHYIEIKPMTGKLKNIENIKSTFTLVKYYFLIVMLCHLFIFIFPISFSSDYYTTFARKWKILPTSHTFHTPTCTSTFIVPFYLRLLFIITPLSITLPLPHPLQHVLSAFFVPRNTW